LQWRWGPLVLGLVAAMAVARDVDAADARSVSGLSKSLAIEESRSGAASPQLLPLLERLAGAQFDDGALGEAADSRRRALNTANAMIALADVEILRHRYTAAEPLLTAALLVLQPRLGAENPSLAVPLAALARIAIARGDVPAAEAWANRANAIAGHRPSAASCEPLRALGAVYAAEGRFDQGERVLRAAVARDQRAHGAASLETARSLAQLANLLLRAQRFDEALAPLEQAIAIDQERLGPNHPLIADDFADLGLIYAGLGRDDDASDALYFAIDLLNRSSSQETTRLGYAELEIAPILRRLGQAEDADDAFKDARRILDDAAKDERQHERQL
jgi:tetratricopeptide (TPR) repeat protein